MSQLYPSSLSSTCSVDFGDETAMECVEMTRYPIIYNSLQQQQKAWLGSNRVPAQRYGVYGAFPRLSFLK